MKIKQLTPNAKNPRKITDAKRAQLKKALLEFGDLSGIIFNRKSKQLVGGHQRRDIFDENADVTIVKKYLKPTKTGTVAEGYVELNGERFGYREVYWDKHTEMAANIAANKGAGVWDDAQLGEWLKELSSFDTDFDMDLTMFDADELSEFEGITVKEHTRTSANGTDEDEVPEVEAPKSRLGDLYLLGEHRLLCGDSTILAHVSRLMNGHNADMVFTDPPYNVAYEGKTDRKLTIENDAMSPAQFTALLEGVFASISAAAAPGTPVYMCCPIEDGTFLNSWLKSKIKLQSILIWLKNSMVMGRKDYHYKHEPILYGWVSGAAHKWYGDRDKTTVFECARPPRNGEHPTMKPVELCEHFISNSSREGERVLDLFGGSGSTLIACEKTHRCCYMMELDPRYCDVIVARWEKYTGVKAKLVRAETVVKRNPAKQVKMQVSGRA